MPHRFLAQNPKKALRLITNSHRLAHTESLFKELNILTIEKLYVFSVQLFIFKFSNAMLPAVFSDFFVVNADVHDYNTRQRLQYHTPIVHSQPSFFVRAVYKLTSLSFICWIYFDMWMCICSKRHKRFCLIEFWYYFPIIRTTTLIKKITTEYRHSVNWMTCNNPISFTHPLTHTPYAHPHPTPFYSLYPLKSMVSRQTNLNLSRVKHGWVISHRFLSISPLMYYLIPMPIWICNGK